MGATASALRAAVNTTKGEKAETTSAVVQSLCGVKTPTFVCFTALYTW